MAESRICTGLRGLVFLKIVDSGCMSWIVDALPMMSRACQTRHLRPDVPILLLSFVTMQECLQRTLHLLLFATCGASWQRVHNARCATMSASNTKLQGISEAGVDEGLSSLCCGICLATT